MKNVQTSVLYERLCKAAAYLERLNEERSSCGDPTLGKAIETRIIWRELLDLELQEFDDEIERRSEVALGLVPEGRTVAHADGGRPSSPTGSSRLFWGEIPQHPQRDKPPSLWWRLSRFFH
jgi:hypothetical protein